MKSLKFFIVVFITFALLFCSSFSYAQLGDQEGRDYMSTGTFHTPNNDLLAVYEMSIWPVENITNPPGPLPDKYFFVNANCVLAGEDATFRNISASHAFWAIENQKISSINGISILTFNVNGRWNPLHQQTGDWPRGERGCSVFKAEYQINNSIFGLFVAINNDLGNFGIVLKKENGFWRLDPGDRPGYQFPFSWSVQNKTTSTTWASIKGVGR